MVDTKQAVLGVGLLGALAFLATRTSAKPVDDTTEIKGCTNPKADNYNSKANVDDGSCKFTLTPIEDLIPDDLADDSVWKSDGLVVKLEHPLAATNNKFNKYYFEAKLVIDVVQSGAYQTWADVPETFRGDYSWELRRFGGLTKWTNESQADDIRGSLSKTLLTSSVDGIKPNYETVLNAFGGYVPNYAAVNMGSVQIQSGTFADTGGQWRYVDSKGNKVSNQQIVLDLNGNQINPPPLRMQVKCSGDTTWTDVANPVVVIGSLVAENDNGTVKYFPADAPNGYLPSGLPYGCTIPIKTESLPNTIRVIEENGANTKYGLTANQISLDDLITSPYNVSVPKSNDWATNERAIYDTLFTSLNFPMVHKDSNGYYILNKAKNYQKAYINTLIPGFDLLYQRRQVQCTCPGGTVKAGQTVTVYDTNNCPSFTSIADQNKYCGGMSSGGGSGSSSGGSGGLSGQGGGNFQWNNAEQYINSAQSFIHY
jgi:uncharacterized membrane protein YgcG